MKAELLPIIAAYLGQKCSYDGTTLETLVTWELDNFRMLPKYNFKLHLRKLWSVTEAELLELGKILDEEKPKVDISIFNYTGKRQLKKSYDSAYEYILEIEADSDREYLRINHHEPVKIINWLRGKGFCCDLELIENDLVEWI